MHVLNQHMDDMFAGQEVLELKNDAAYEADEKEVPLPRPTTPIGIFRDEMNALRQMADRDLLEELPKTVLLENNQATDGATSGNRVGEGGDHNCYVGNG